MKPAIVKTVHTKPTHLHSHLLLPPLTGKHSKSKRECKQPHQFSANRPCKTILTALRTDRRAADNKGFVKLGVQWLIEHSTSHQLLWYIDSFVLRNPQLHKPPNRYGQ